MNQQTAQVESQAARSAGPELYRDVSAQLADAERLIAEEQKSAAIAVLEPVLQRNPSDPLANCLLAQIAIENGQIAQARSLLDTARRHGKALVRARIRCAEAEIMRRQKIEAPALAGFKAVLEQHRTGGTDIGTAVMALLGIAHIRSAAGDLTGAAECLEELGRLAPDNIAMQRLLVPIFYQQENYPAAAASLGKILTKNTADSGVFASYGVVLATLGRRREAVQALRIAIRLDPGYVAAMKKLATILYELNELDEIPVLMRRVLELDPHDSVAAHTLAAITGGAPPERASDSYIRGMFDDFASEFDQLLVGKLHYVTPQLLGDRLARVLGAAARHYVILDAGCGTGLCGARLRPYAERLVGVDLSGKMLEKARERQLYDELVESELVGFLDRHPAGFDVIAAADVFVYFGDLMPAFDSAGRALRPGGVVAMSVERFDGDADYKLNIHGRYSHSEAYIRRLADGAGLDMVLLDTVPLRTERGHPVQGMVAILRKNAS